MSDIVAGLQGADTLALKAFNLLGSIPGLAAFGSALSAVGSGYLWVALALWLLAAKRSKERLIFVAAVIVALLATGFVTDVIKDYVARPRPYQVLADVTRYGRLEASFAFPSGHASRAFAAAIVFWAWFPDRRWAWLGLAGVIALMRMVLGVHYPSDVMAGIALGAVMGLVTVGVFGSKPGAVSRLLRRPLKDRATSQ
ncbi:MAG: phosphatase PAP2 family protein [Candidatus Aquicultorales bacterium]